MQETSPNSPSAPQTIDQLAMPGGNGPSTMVTATLLGASSLTVMAGAAVTPALPSIEEAFAGTPNAEILARLILTIPALSIAIMGPIAGRVIDIVGGRRTLLVCLTLYALAGTSALYLPTLHTILAGRVLLGFAVAGIMTAATTLISEYFVGIKRGQILGLQGAFMSGSSIFFVTGGGALTEFHWRAPFVVYLASLLLLPSAFFALKGHIKTSHSNSAANTKRETESHGIALSFIYISAFLGMAAFYMIPVQLPFLLERSIGVKPTMTGVAIGVLSVVAACSALSFSRLKPHVSYMYLLAICFGGMGVSYLIISFAANFTTILIAMVAAGWGLGYLMPTINNAISEIAGPANRGRLLGLLTTFIFLGQFLSPILAKPLINGRGLAYGFGVAGGLLLVIATGLALARLCGVRICITTDFDAPHTKPV